MKSNLQVLKIVPLAFIALAALMSCAGHDDGRVPASPIPPGTAQQAVGTPGAGKFQGSILNKSGVAQAILTLDVWEKNNQTNAQLTLSPNGATVVIPLSPQHTSFASEFPVVVSGVNTTVSISGEWTGSTWTGRLSLFDETTNTFELTAGASTQAAVAVGVPSGVYEGVLKSRTGDARDVELVIKPSADFGTALVSTLSSRVSLSGFLKYADRPQESLTDLVWDGETSTLSAAGSIPTKLGVASLDCKMSEMNARDRDVLQCAVGASKSVTTLATGSLQQKHIVVAPPYPGPPVQPNPVPQPGPPPAPTPYQPPPPNPVPAPTAAPVPVPTAIPVPVPTPSLILKTAKEFVGSAVFTSAQGQKQTRSLTLSVGLSTEPTGQAQPAKVKFILDGSRVGANFNEGTYNSATGELSAKQLLSLGALPGLLELSCRGVKFETPQYDFTCHYESSVTNVTGEFHLQGSQP